jgi:hypothetical protein
MSAPQSNLSRIDPDAVEAARALMFKFPDRAIEALARHCNPIDTLRDACVTANLDFHGVINDANRALQEAQVSAENVAPKQSRRSTGDSAENKRPQFPGMQQALFDTDTVVSARDRSHSSGSTPGSLLKITIMQIRDNELATGTYSEGYCLIRSDRAELLEETPKPLKHLLKATHNDRPIQCREVVVLIWRMASLKQSHKNIFLLVPASAIDVDVVIGRKQPKFELLQEVEGLPSFRYMVKTDLSF